MPAEGCLERECLPAPDLTSDGEHEQSARESQDAHEDIIALATAEDVLLISRNTKHRTCLCV